METQKRISWNEYFMLNAHLISTRSTCTRLKVGSLLVKDNRIIATGYNGGISGDEHCIDVGCYMENNSCQRCIHAEDNALIQCSREGISTRGADIYVTHFPCVNCTKKILQSGIKTIYYTNDYKNSDYCYQLLEKANVKAIQMNSEVEFEMKWNENSHEGHLNWKFEQ